MILTSLATSCFGLLWLWKDPDQESIDASRFIIKHQKCVPELVTKSQMKICSVEIIISVPSLFFCVCLFQKRDSKPAPGPKKSLGGKRGRWGSSHIFPLGRLHCLRRHSTDPNMLAHLFRTVCNSVIYHVQNQAVPMPRRVQGTGIGEEGEDFTTSAEIVVLAALTPCGSLELCAFPASRLFRLGQIGFARPTFLEIRATDACVWCAP